MTLPASGAISLGQVNTELGHAAGTPISMNDADIRDLFGKSSGAIAMGNGYSKPTWHYAHTGEGDEYFFRKRYPTGGFYALDIYWHGTYMPPVWIDSDQYSYGGYLHKMGALVETVGTDQYHYVSRIVA